MSLARTTSQEVLLWENAEKVQTIKQCYAKGATNAEFAVFCEIGKLTGLNPFLREIWCVKYGDTPASIFIGRDGYRKSAQANPDYDYHMSDAVYENDVFSMEDGIPGHTYSLKDRGKLVGAYAVVKRKSSSKTHFVYVELGEYKSTSAKSLWAKMPATMIKKVAEAQCLRMAFQALFAGTYDESEEFYVKGETVEVSEKAVDLNAELNAYEYNDVAATLMQCNTRDELHHAFDKASKIVRQNADDLAKLIKLKDTLKEQLTGAVTAAINGQLHKDAHV